jgi:hypothetical protein
MKSCLEKAVSDNVRSYGFIAVLKEPIDDISEISDKLWRAKSQVMVNYEGTLAYIDFSLKKSYSERSDFYGLFIGSEQMDPAELTIEAAKHGLDIDESTIKPYTCVWYNGTDSPMSELKKEEFLKK